VLKIREDTQQSLPTFQKLIANTQQLFAAMHTGECKLQKALHRRTTGHKSHGPEIKVPQDYIFAVCHFNSPSSAGFANLKCI
jgi:hypothetical protein